MIGRFRGIEGRSRLVSALRKQVILHDNETLSKELSDHAELAQLERDDQLIVQDEADDDVFFILAGRLSIVINGREVAIRRSGQHVGEMALIDPTARRSASIIAIERTVVAKVSEASFRPLADKYPRVWQLIAMEIGERLRERNKLVVSKNPRPVLFLGSSTESLPIAQTIQSNLDHDDLIVRLWSNSVFGASQFPIAELEKQVQEADFAALILGPDDQVVSRSERTDAPRDNVIFELGLFMGALSHHRTFMIVPRGCNIKVPTDLLGLIPLDYKKGNSIDLPALLGPICNEIRRKIEKVGVK